MTTAFWLPKILTLACAALRVLPLSSRLFSRFFEPACQDCVRLPHLVCGRAKAWVAIGLVKHENTN